MTPTSSEPHTITDDGSGIPVAVGAAPCGAFAVTAVGLTCPAELVVAPVRGSQKQTPLPLLPLPLPPIAPPPPPSPPAATPAELPMDPGVRVVVEASIAVAPVLTGADVLGSAANTTPLRVAAAFELAAAAATGAALDAAVAAT